jgi:polyisoprenoid-binding protein YceI
LAWQVDFTRSGIFFEVKHMMFAKVRGRFQKFDGVFNFDELKPDQSTFDVTIDAASINTGDKQRDAHLRSSEFLKTSQYPTLTFKSKRIVQRDKRRGRLVGDLTIRNITKEVSLDVVYNGPANNPRGTTSHGFSGQTTIQRKNWDLTWSKALEAGSWLVDDKIKINIAINLIKAPD